MDDWIIPLLVLDRIPRSQRAAVTEQLLPVMLPGPSSQRLAVAAITAEEQAKRQAVAEFNLVKEVVEVTKFKSAEELQKSPFSEHYSAFSRLTPEDQAKIFPAPDGTEDNQKRRAGRSMLATATPGESNS
jgi:hypothetical protein